jgi:hypothetical protein
VKKAFTSPSAAITIKIQRASDRAPHGAIRRLSGNQQAKGVDFDRFGISIVASGDKSAIDTLAHLYEAHGIRRFIVFDNDDGNAREKATNTHPAQVADFYAAPLPDPPGSTPDGKAERAQ